jgi:hypothetical protein
VGVSPQQPLTESKSSLHTKCGAAAKKQIPPKVVRANRSQALEHAPFEDGRGETTFIWIQNVKVNKVFISNINMQYVISNTET